LIKTQKKTFMKTNTQKPRTSSKGLTTGEKNDSSDGITELMKPLNEAATLRLYFGICRAWNLSPAQEQALLGVDMDTCQQWSRGELKTTLLPQTLERISYVVRIFAAIRSLIQPVAVADAWVHAANTAPLFGGGTALQKMLAPASEDLLQVCGYLEAQLSGDFL
jgi:hypothetical protein